MNVSFLSFHVISPLNFHKRKTEPKTEPLKQENEKPADFQRVSKFVSGERGILFRFSLLWPNLLRINTPLLFLYEVLSVISNNYIIAIRLQR